MYKALEDLQPEVLQAIRNPPIRSKKYRASFRNRACLCGCNDRESVVGHHLLIGTLRAGRKSSDCFIIPLCSFHHTGSKFCIHENEKLFFERLRLKCDPREMAYYMWKIWNEKKLGDVGW